MATIISLVITSYLWIACGAYSATVAGSKGHRSIAWFFGGLLTGPVALIAATGLPDLESRRLLRQPSKVDYKRGISPEPFRRESQSRSGLFSGEEWNCIYRLVRESGSDPALVSSEMSYFTSAATSVVCDKNGSILIEITRSERGEWTLSS